MFFKRAKHRLPKFPPNVAQTFKMLCGLVEEDELLQLKDALYSGLQETMDKSKTNENLDVEVAKQLTDTCLYLLERYNQFPDNLKKFLIGAVRYVAIADDPFDDDTFATGFYDDMRVVNHVLEKLGIEDRYLKV